MVRCFLLLMLLACTGCASTPTPTPTDRVRVESRGKAFVRAKHNDLQAFKGKADFHTYGFASGGPYASWLHKVDRQNDGSLPIREGVALGELRTLALEYKSTRGIETETTRQLEKFLRDYLDSGE